MISFDLKNKNTWFFIGGIIFVMIILFIIFSKILKKRVNKNTNIKRNNFNLEEMSKDFFPLQMNENKDEDIKDEIKQNRDEREELKVREDEKIPDIRILPQLLDNFPNPQAKSGILQLILKNYGKLIQEFADIKTALPDFTDKNVKIPENLQEKINEYNERAKVTYDKLSDGLDQFTKMLIDEISQYVGSFKNKTTDKGVPFSKELNQNELSRELNLNILTLKLSIEILQSFLDSNLLSKNLKGNIIKLIDENELGSIFSDFYSFSTNYSQGSMLKGAKFTDEVQANINDVKNSFRKLINFIPLPSPPSTSLEIVQPQKEISKKNLEEYKQSSSQVYSSQNDSFNGIAIPPQQPLDLNRNNFPSQIRKNIPLSDLASIVENGKM